MTAQTENVESTVVVLVKRERKMGGDPGYVTRERSSHNFPSSQSLTRRAITATSPPHHQPTCHPAGNLADMEGSSNRENDSTTVTTVSNRFVLVTD